VWSTRPAKLDAMLRDLRISKVQDGVVVLSFDDDDAPKKPLTKAEAEVLSLAIGGDSDAVIARKRSCSARTVASLLRRAYAKLGTTSRAEASARLALMAASTHSTR
jgi:DNA-binding CsgD family transcriptional regulator